MTRDRKKGKRDRREEIRCGGVGTEGRCNGDR